MEDIKTTNFIYIEYKEDLTQNTYRSDEILQATYHLFSFYLPTLK